MITYRAAKRSIQEHFLTKWKDGIANGLPTATPVLPPLVIENAEGSYEPKVYFQNIEIIASVPLRQHFAILTIENINSEQSSLPGSQFENNGTKFNTIGVGFVQLFFSKDSYSTEEEEYLSAIAQDIFTKKLDCVWFRRSTIKDLEPEEKHYRTNVTFEYEFESVLGQTA